MNKFLILDYPVYFLFFCFLTGIAYAFLLYKNDNAISSKAWRNTLFAIRTVTVSLISFLLLSPIFKNKVVLETKPIIVLLEDNTLSVKEQTKPSRLKLYRESMDVLIERLEAKFTVKKYTFGEDIEDWKAPNYDQKVTNISKSINDLHRRMLNKKVGGIILATDGIYNEGNNPFYDISDLQSSFYTIGLGDTILKKDLRISQLRNNNIVYLGDFFQLEIDVSAYNLNGKGTTLQVFNQDNISIYSEKIDINSTNFFTTKQIVIEAKKLGVCKYRVLVTNVEGEVTYINNSSWIYVDVLDGKQKVLVLYDAPHPDIYAIGSMIKSQKNYEFKAERINRFKDNLEDYSCIILHGLPSSSQSLSSLKPKLDKLNVFYIVSSKTDLNQLNLLQNTLQISGKNLQKNEVLALPNMNFSNFILSQNIIQLMSKFPPIVVPFADYKTAPSANILLYQKIGNVETNYPLLVLSNNSGNKVAVMVGEGLWRWNMYDNKQSVEEGGFREIFGKTIRYLSLKEDKRKFKLNLPQNIIGEHKDIYLTAELYNDNYETVTTPDVTVKFKSQDGKEYIFIMDKHETYFSLNAGKLPVGDYAITASTKFNKQELKASASLSIEPLQLEQANIQANHQLLAMMSNNTGGKYAEIENISTLEEHILSDVQLKPILSESYKIKSLLDLKWMFILILSLLTFEWVARKWLGTV